jgi:hypothetical protein
MQIKFDGKDIDVSHLDLNQLIAVEEKFGSLAKLGQEIPVKVIRFLAYLVIHPSHPDLTEEQIGAKLDMNSVGQIVKVLSPVPNLGSERPLEQA